MSYPSHPTSVEGNRNIGGPLSTPCDMMEYLDFSLCSEEPLNTTLNNIPGTPVQPELPSTDWTFYKHLCPDQPDAERDAFDSAFTAAPLPDTLGRSDGQPSTADRVAEPLRVDLDFELHKVRAVCKGAEGCGGEIAKKPKAIADHVRAHLEQKYGISLSRPEHRVVTMQCFDPKCRSVYQVLELPRHLKTSKHLFVGIRCPLCKAEKPFSRGDSLGRHLKSTKCRGCSVCGLRCTKPREAHAHVCGPP